MGKFRYKGVSVGGEIRDDDGNVYPDIRRSIDAFGHSFSDKKYTEGKIYDPKSGKTYSGQITQSDTNTLKLRGYIGVSLIGRSTIWTRSEK